MTASTTDTHDDLISVYLGQWKSLRNFLSRRTGSRDLADNAMQETWFRLSAMKDGTAIHDRQAFILRVASNIASDLLRKERRHTARSINDEALLLGIADSYPSPEAFAIDRDQLRQLVLALSRLAPKPRQALLMSRCDGRSHAEIADQLGVSESMVAKYLAQALRCCRDHVRQVG